MDKGQCSENVGIQILDMCPYFNVFGVTDALDTIPTRVGHI